jgi:hypothetical protein
MEDSHVTLYHGPAGAPDLSPETTKATRSRLRFGRESPTLLAEPDSLREQEGLGLAARGR